jgi:pyruvate dehydrogenase E1 component alpha subunit
MFEHTFAEIPPHLREQYEEFAALREQYGDSAFLED